MAGEAEPVCLPPSFVALLTLHGPRAWVATAGLQLEISKLHLQMCARWVPQDSPEDYCRDSRTIVHSTLTRITSAIHEGWRPNECLQVDRACDDVALELNMRRHALDRPPPQCLREMVEALMNISCLVEHPSHSIDLLAARRKC